MPPTLFFLAYVFFFNDTATTEIYTLSLHDALPICDRSLHGQAFCPRAGKKYGSDTRRSPPIGTPRQPRTPGVERSEEHTSELQSLAYLVCRLLLEKKKKKKTQPP